MHGMIDDAVHKFVDDERYYFHYYCNQLPVELTRAIEKHLKDSDGVEYWCRLHLIGKTILGKRDLRRLCQIYPGQNGAVYFPPVCQYPVFRSYPFAGTGRNSGEWYP